MEGTRIQRFGPRQAQSITRSRVLTLLATRSASDS